MALDKNGIAKRIAQELENNTYVNLGIGIPTLVANHYTTIWHTIWDRGIEIKPQAAPEVRPPRSGRVDGMQNEEISDSLPAYLSEQIDGSTGFHFGFTLKECCYIGASLGTRGAVTQAVA